MSIFIDTGIFVAFFNVRDVNHKRAVELIKKAVRGGFGLLYTSDYIFDESVTVALMRTKKLSIAVNVGRLILGELEGIPPFLIRLAVDERVFEEAWKLFSNYAEKGLSFTDCTSISLIKTKGIEAVMSFDKGFDGLITRVC
jgi:hypothetical protein